MKLHKASSFHLTEWFMLTQAKKMVGSVLLSISLERTTPSANPTESSFVAFFSTHSSHSEEEEDDPEPHYDEKGSRGGRR